MTQRFVGDNMMIRSVRSGWSNQYGNYPKGMRTHGALPGEYRTLCKRPIRSEGRTPFDPDSSTACAICAAAAPALASALGYVIVQRVQP